MPTQLAADTFGRMIILTSDGTNDTYVVIGSDGEVFNVQYPTGTPSAQVYASIESQVPASVAAAQAAAAQAPTA